MYIARRSITVPASTFSEIAASKKPAGAMTGTVPLATSSSDTTPSTPPKWSVWLWV